jgi:hypothetical protein
MSIRELKNVFFAEISNGYFLLSLLPFLCSKGTSAPEQQSNWVHRMQVRCGTVWGSTHTELLLVK